MNDEIDLKEFENLSGADFSRYTARMKDAQISISFLDYFRVRKNQWDAIHLELALWWLGKSGLPAAYQELANFIDHSNATFRFLAIGFISEMKQELDAQIMSRVIEALEQNPDEADSQRLNTILAKPASKDALLLAQRYSKAKKEGITSRS